MFNKRVRERLLTPTDAPNHSAPLPEPSPFTHVARLSLSDASQLGFSLSRLSIYIGDVLGPRLQTSDR